MIQSCTWGGCSCRWLTAILHFSPCGEAEVRERAVRTRRKPGGGKRREPLGARKMAFKVFHESRDTAFQAFTSH